MSIEAGHPELETLERFRRRELPPRELLPIGDHVAACEECRRRLLEAELPDAPVAGGPALHHLFETELLSDAFHAFRRDLGASTGDFHVAAEQLTAYLDDELDGADREVVEGHLESCESCAGELRDLRSFKAHVATYPPQEHRPAPPPSPFTKFRRSVTRQAVVFPLQAAALTTILAMVASALTFRGRIEAERGRAVTLQKQVTKLQQEKQQLATRITGAQGTVGSVKQRALDAEQEVAALKRQLRTARRPIRGGLGDLIKDGDAVVDGDGVRWRRGEGLPEPVVAALGQPAQPPAVIAQLSIPAPASDSPSFPLKQPGRTVITSEQPTLSWSPMAGATSYTVLLYDHTDNRELASSPLLQTTEWTPPTPLPRGHVLWWEVTALKEGELIGRATGGRTRAAFRVIEQAAADELEAARRAHTDSPLAQALLTREAGLLPEAEQQLQELLKANRRNRTLQALLESVRRWQTEGAGG